MFSHLLGAALHKSFRSGWYN